MNASTQTRIGVVSLVPSITETLMAWGVPPVGVTRFCEVPERRDGPIRVGGTKNPDLDRIIAMAPALVIMDEEENRLEDADALKAAGVPVHATRVRSVDDVAPTLRELGRAVGYDVAGQTVGSPPGFGSARTGRATVWVPIWRRPWMSIGPATYGSSILAAAGLDNVCGTSEVAYPEQTLETAAALQPDFVLAPTEPYRFAERHRPELEQVAPAVFVDGQDLFWWGSRTPQALVRLRRLATELAER